MKRATPISAFRPGDRSRKGMSLLELIIAIGIFGVAALMCLLVLSTSVERNRSTRMTVAATSAARQTIEETRAMAGLRDVAGISPELSDDFGNSDISKPEQLCAYLLSDSLATGFEVTRVGNNPLRQIICRFPAMVPGESARTAEGLKQFVNGPPPGLPAGAIVAEATMTVYLDESQVPTEVGGTVAPMWRDLGQNSTIEGPPGFDINGDGIIQTGGVRAANGDTEFTMVGAAASYQRLAQVPVDVTLVYYYQDPGANADRTLDRRGRQTHTYRLIVTNL